MSDHTFYLAGCIITNRSGEILMLHRNSEHRSQWELPGGRVEPSEDTRAAVARELSNHLGLEVEVRHLLGEKHTTDEGRTIHYSWFATHIIAGEPKLKQTDVYDMHKYMSVEELQSLHHELSPNARSLVDAIRRGDIQL